MRASTSKVSRRARHAAALIVALSSTLGAQLPSSSPAAYAMAGNYTAMARGYEAVAWNAANLAMPGRPFLSIGLGVVGGTVGMDPVGFNTLNAFSGVVVDSATRAGWVDLVRTSKRQRVRVDGSVTGLGLSVGPIGLQVGTSMYTNVDMSPDAFEAIMFGNAGNNNGQPKNLDFTGTGVSAGVISTGALSFALPIPFRFTGGILANEHLAVAVTGKYVVGHVLLQATDGGSVMDANGVTYSFPMIVPAGFSEDDISSGSSTEYNGQIGSGTGADLSAAWSAGPWKVGVMMENVFNSFKWDTTKLAYQANAGYTDADTSYSTSGEAPYGTAPLALREQIAGQTFKPAINIGVAFKPTPFLTVTADMRQQTGDADALAIGPKNRMGVGAELRILPFIPLRAGVASVTDGWQAGAGFGIRLLGYELGVSGSLRRRGTANESGLMIGMFGIGH